MSTKIVKSKSRKPSIKPLASPASQTPRLTVHPAPASTIAPDAAVTIDLLCAISPADRPYSGLGAAFYCPGLKTPRGIAIVLNRSSALVNGALIRHDRALIAFLVAELFAEFLAFRSRYNPLVGALQKRLASRIFHNRINPPPSILLTNFAVGLATQFIGPGLPAPLTIDRQLIRSFTFECDPKLLDIPWEPPPKRIKEPAAIS
jgi:hypothetical protein